MCMEIKEIIEINRNLGGSPLKLSNLEFDLDKANEESSPYRKCAFLIRGIVVGHSFVDFNKSTATTICLNILHKESILCKEESFTKLIIKIAKESISDINKIEVMLRRCCLKKN